MNGERTNSATGPLPESMVREALSKVLASPEFARSRRTSSFLNFVVDETLTGRGERLKAFTIAQEVYGRDETFDPRSDAIVRVEAGRLRQRLQRYYEEEGRKEPVRIELPKGTYVPEFKRGHAETSELKTPATDSRTDPGKNADWKRAILLAVPLLAVLAVTVWLVKSGEPGGTEQSITSTASPFVAVLPLTSLSGDPMEQRLAGGLVEAIITNLAKLSGLSVMAHASVLDLEHQPASIENLKQEFGATHVLRGGLEHANGKIRVSVQLIDTATSATIWADHLDGAVTELFDLQDKLAAQIADTLSVHITPDEQTRFAHRHTSVPEALVLYRQGFILLMPPSDMTRIMTARELFYRVIELDPGFAGGYAGAAFSHTVTVLFLKQTQPGEELEKGIALAKNAIEKDPTFGMAYSSLALAYALSGNPDEGLKNARRAVAVQPGDAFTQMILGMNLVLAGQPEEAIAPLQAALRLDPAEPRTPYLNVLAIAYFVSGRYSLALDTLDRNVERGGPTGPHMFAFRAAAYAEVGEEALARKTVNRILQSHSTFPTEQWISQWTGQGEKLGQAMNHLFRLGLPGQHG